MLSRYLGVSLFLLIFLATACWGVDELALPLFAKSPRERYVNALEKSDLQNSILAQEWLAVGEQALRDSLYLATPAATQLYFSPRTPAATGYRLSLREGTVLKVTLEKDTTYRVFTELFRVDTSAIPWYRQVAYINEGEQVLTYEIKEDGDYLLRLQAELLAGGKVQLTVTTDPVWGMPVEGADNSAIQSLFGVARDGGSRSHEGIDIFAPKGTPVRALVSGRVRVRTGGLGGKTVWLNDSQRQMSLYYAHLDSQWVSSGQIVRTGDTLGQVGNTGNARYTPSHLHFGVYTWQQGAIDPLAYVRQETRQPAAVQIDTALLGTYVRTTSRQTALLADPKAKRPTSRSLTANTPLRVLGGYEQFMQVEEADGRTGFVAARQVKSAMAALRTIQLAADQPVYAYADSTSATIAVLPKGESAAILGQTGPYQLVALPLGDYGWIF